MLDKKVLGGICTNCNHEFIQHCYNEIGMIDKWTECPTDTNCHAKGCKCAYFNAKKPENIKYE